MPAARYKNSNTGTNVSSLINMINDPKCVTATLFVATSTSNADTTLSGGLVNNEPLVAALVKYSIPRVEDIDIVFDGVFLTAVRYPRYTEVRQLLDAAEKTSKVYFAIHPVQFTSMLTPEIAAQKLLEIQSTVKFSSATRAQYFSLLSSLPEEQGAIRISCTPECRLYYFYQSTADYWYNQQ